MLYPHLHWRQSFVRMPIEDVTTVSMVSSMLYRVVIGFAILLFPIKELLATTLVCTGNVSQSQLFGFEHCGTSKNFGIAQERLSSAPQSDEYAISNPNDEISKVD